MKFPFTLLLIACLLTNLPGQSFNIEFNCEFDTECVNIKNSFISAYIFPNPTEDEIFIGLKKGNDMFDVKGKIDVSVFSITGQFLIHSDKSRLDVIDLPIGIYLVVIKVYGELFYSKFTKI